MSERLSIENSLETRSYKHILTSYKFSRNICLIGIILLTIYLVSVRVNIYLPIQIFWASLFIILSALVWWIISCKDDQLISVLPLSLLSIWLLKTIFIPVSVPFFGSDAYIEQAAALEISLYGWIGLDPWVKSISGWVNSTNYPLLSAISISLTRPIGFPMESWARWAMPVISLLSVCLIYSISIEIYKSKRAALLGSLGFGMTYMYLMFHSLFLREAIAFPLFLAAIYAYIKSRSVSNLRLTGFYRISALICGIGVVFSHHLTSLLLLLFGLLIILVSNLLRNPIRLNEKNSTVKENVTFSGTFWVFLAVVLLTYWVYLHKSPINIITTIIEDITSGAPASSFSLPSTARYNILLYNQIISTLFFALLALIGLLPQKNQRNNLQVAAVTWGGICGLLSLFFAIAGIPGTGSVATRFELFGYAFLIPAAASTVINLTAKHRWLALPLGILFVYYGLNNVYRFPLFLYSNIQPNFLKEEIRPILLPEEYNLISKINSKTRVASDMALSRLIRPISGVPAYNWFNNPGSEDLNQSVDFDYLVIGERERTILDSNEYGKTLEDLGLSRLYSSGLSAVYVPLLRAATGFTMSEILSASHASSDGVQVLNWKAWLLLVVEIALICLIGIIIVSSMKSFTIGDFSLGVVLVFIGIFFIYLASNVMGFTSPGISVLFILLFTSILGLTYKKYYTYLNISTVSLLGLMCAIVLGYGLFIDPLSQKLDSRSYSEFYVENIVPCSDALCINLKLTSHERQKTAYQIDGFNGTVNLDPLSTWQGTLRVPITANTPITIGLHKLPGSQTSESLFIHLNN